MCDLYRCWLCDFQGESTSQLQAHVKSYEHVKKLTENNLFSSEYLEELRRSKFFEIKNFAFVSKCVRVEQSQLPCCEQIPSEGGNENEQQAQERTGAKRKADSTTQTMPPLKRLRPAEADRSNDALRLRNENAQRNENSNLMFLTCRLCQKVFQYKSKSSLDQHNASGKHKTMERTTKRPYKLYKCCGCMNIFLHFQVAQHFNAIKGITAKSGCVTATDKHGLNWRCVGNMFACQYCKVTCRSLNETLDHVNQPAHLRMKSSQVTGNSENITCNLCDKTFRKLNDVISHGLGEKHWKKMEDMEIRRNVM